MSSEIETTLKERGENYGEFRDHAILSQGIKNAMRQGLGWPFIDLDKKECLEMVAHKIARILNGDPNYHDSWHDIIGYVTLIEKGLKKD